ncbi:DUF2277 domain-containing protein [soil metagenome]
MCRNIKTLFNFAPPATDDEVRAASIQFVRKLSGYQSPSKSNEKAFQRAIDQTFKAARALLDSLETDSEPKDRATEAAKAAERNLIRFGPRPTRRKPSRVSAARR